MNNQLIFPNGVFAFQQTCVLVKKTLLSDFIHKPTIYTNRDIEEFAMAFEHAFKDYKWNFSRYKKTLDQTVLHFLSCKIGRHKVMELEGQRGTIYVDKTNGAVVGWTSPSDCGNNYEYCNITNVDILEYQTFWNVNKLPDKEHIDAFGWVEVNGYKPASKILRALKKGEPFPKDEE